MHQNGNGGNDHGHGNVRWVMGGPVRGSKIYGRWPGLSTADLYQERDLAVTTDFREPIATVLKSHLQFSDAQIARIFPTPPPPTPPLHPPNKKETPPPPPTTTKQNTPPAARKR